MKQDADERAQAFKKKLDSRSKSETEAQIAKTQKLEQEQIARIDELYNAKHKKWEKAITEKIISGD